MHSFTLPLFNRDFQLPADGKVQVVPVGEFPVIHNGRQIVQVVDAKACQAMVGNLEADSQHPNFGGLCVDFDHFRHDPSKESRAAGWVMNAERRADGVYCAPRWTGSGRAALDDGDYRFISPEFDPQSLEALGGNRYRVTRLIGFGLTNSPNMRGMAALTNRLTGAGGTVDAAQQAKAHADLVSDLAKSLRGANKSLSLTESYRRAKLAMDPATGEAGNLVIANRAQELRAKDKHLSITASYRLAQSGS